MAASSRALNVRGVVFDLDGTLVDSFRGLQTATNAAMAHFGLEPLARAEVTRMVGGGVFRLVEQAVGRERAEAGVSVFREAYAAVCGEQTDALPDAEPTLRALAGLGVGAGVASNKSVAYSEIILSRLGLRPLLVSVEGPETAGVLKPDPTMIRGCLRAMGVTADAALYVGDMPQDVEAGRRAGVRVVLVSGGASPDAALCATGVTVLPRLFDLIATLGHDAPRGKSS